MKLTESEWTLMKCVWESPAASVRDVWERVAPTTGWRYSTVKTMLTRLVQKGALSMEKRANTSLFRPLITSRAARRSAVRTLLDNAFDGTFGSLLQHMAHEERLSAQDRAKLAEMLNELDRRKKS